MFETIITLVTIASFTGAAVALRGRSRPTPAKVHRSPESELDMMLVRMMGR